MLRTRVVCLALGVLALAANASPPMNAALRHDPIRIHERHGNQVTSSNWSGYAVTGANGSVTNVKGSWIVPSVNCGSTPTAYASFWVGIDGYSSNTVEQIGTDSDCQNGSPSYYAWFEFYPHPSFTVNTLAIKPGDVLSAQVTYNGGRFTVSLTNETTMQSFSTSTKMNSAKRSSAEWIIEAPSSGGVLPLADFNTVSYGADYTSVRDSCDATVGSTTGAIGTFGANVDEITMETNSGIRESQPSKLSKDGSSFMDHLAKLRPLSEPHPCLRSQTRSPDPQLINQASARSRDRRAGFSRSLYLRTTNPDT